MTVPLPSGQPSSVALSNKKFILSAALAGEGQCKRFSRSSQSPMSLASTGGMSIQLPPLRANFRQPISTAQSAAEASPTYPVPSGAMSVVTDPPPVGGPNESVTQPGLPGVGVSMLE